MKKEELTGLIAEIPSAPSLQLNPVDKELLRTACEQMSDEEWEQLNDCTIEFLGKHLLTQKTKKNLNHDVDDFLNKMSKRSK